MKWSLTILTIALSAQFAMAQSSSSSASTTTATAADVGVEKTPLKLKGKLNQSTGRADSKIRRVLLVSGTECALNMN